MTHAVRIRLLQTAIAVWLALLLAAPAAVAQAPTTRPSAKPAPLQFVVTYDESITDTFTGRVYVMTNLGSRREPRYGPSWMRPTPFFAVDVSGWKPGKPLVIDQDALSYPGPLSELEAANYAVQAVMRLSRDASEIGAAGNPYSANERFDLDASAGGSVRLRIDQVQTPRPFTESDRIKLVELRSKLLSDFHGRDMMMHAAVILPQTLDENKDRKYPVLYWIGGFGSDHTGARWRKQLWDRTGYSDRVIRIVLSASCYGGHHVFADSANNGPVGRALVEELIPHIEATYPLVSAPTARFVAGHSSGGWASLWLQITYPGVFGGVWSLAPDPIDFSDFQRIDLYKPGVNMYVDAAGQRRPLARRGEQVTLWYEPFGRMEAVVGDGGQLRSFDWVFSPRGADGLPRRLFDPETGAVDPVTAQAWRRYDIRLILENTWATLGAQLAGKLHIIAGEFDTFYLEGPVIALKAWLEDVGSDADVEIVAGADHGSIATLDLWRRIDEALLAVFDRHHPQPAPAEPVGAR
jgi:S-formylglutathione hydrolase FrmB